ncbi:MAG: PEP-utilizing enzyme, partial [Chloroflexota bacterium]
STAKIPTELSQEISASYQALPGNPLAVRSSATAEDLPDMSFAGQQDTFLHVIGEAALLENVVACWGSLWTARAIGYRARNLIPNQDVALAVVVQEMVPSESSGVLFTANPLTGLRSQTVIDATLGLGEALVSGQVEPDHYVVNPGSGEIVDKTLGAKALVMRGKVGGGMVTERVDASDTQAVTDAQILALAKIGEQIQQVYDYPQDIEWAIADDKIFILQSRPITSLFPIPQGMDADPLHVLFSFASVQGLFDPMTPLGQDAIRFIFSGFVSLFGIQSTHETQGIIKIAGERLWGDVSVPLGHPIGRKLFTRMFAGIDPMSIGQLERLKDDPNLPKGKRGLRFKTLHRARKFALPVLKSALHNWRNPDGRASEIEKTADEEVTRVIAGVKDAQASENYFAGSVAMFKEMREAFIYAIPNIFTGAMPGLIGLGILTRFSHELTGSNELAMEVTRGLPNNVTSEMDLILWETSRQIGKDAEVKSHILETTAERLAEEYLDNRLPASAKIEIKTFLDEYGMRGIGEIDIGRPRWREEPTHIMQIMQSYLQIEKTDHAPDKVFALGKAKAQAAVDELAAEVRKTFAGGIKARVIRAAARRVRAFAGMRESPKFHVIKKMGVIRAGLLMAGAKLVAKDRINEVDDIFYLYFNELEAFAAGEKRDWKALIAIRRENYQRELRRKQIPRLIVSDGRAIYEGVGSATDEEGALIGSPVSAGVVEGVARVVLDPMNANLKPGEIMVCVGTDPAWTPLFLAAGGLVMEVGGMMTHGAIVAREYGIPAVVSVTNATEVLSTGQRIRVDGSSGLVVVLEGD